ncbi:hypothetical protein T5B8_15885 [Salinisphaera sp. T5B8]|uniref:NYN domain-containing protein n=1 Tax=Salinisphaera sp. T5B8 TaxID=1304154 RepID=UPI0033426F84
MNRVISYIDGFNLYFGLRAKGWRKYYWLDLAGMSRAVMKPQQALAHCHYFTARIRAGGKSQNAKRQTIWLDALATRDDITCHFGHYLPKEQTCKSCGAKWTHHEEKMTDVNIASQLLVDAYEDRYDTALVVSGDSDLTTPIKMVRQRFPHKRLIVAFPPKRRSDQLRKAAHGHIVIGDDSLRQNLLPDRITTATGYVLERPARWY